MTRTVQLRRYVLVPGVMEEFLAWFQGPLLTARRAHGFRVEFAYPLPATDEFVWAVSVDGDPADFARVDEGYAASAERAAAFAGQPKRVASSQIELVVPLEA